MNILIIFLLLIVVSVIVFLVCFVLHTKGLISKYRKELENFGPDYRKLPPPMFRDTLESKLDGMFKNRNFEDIFTLEYKYSGNNRKVVDVNLSAKDKGNNKLIKSNLGASIQAICFVMTLREYIKQG